MTKPNPTADPISSLKASGCAVAAVPGHDRRRNHCEYLVTPPGVYRDTVLSVPPGTGTVVDDSHLLVAGTIDEAAARLAQVVEAIRNYQSPADTTAPPQLLDVAALRDVAGRAQTATDLAHNRMDDDTNEEYVDPSLLERIYAEAVEDVCRFLAGDAEPTEGLKLVLRAGRVEGDDFPEDQPLGYPPVPR